MPLTFSVHHLGGTIQRAPNITSLLFEAATPMAEIMRRDLRLLFGIGCTHVRIRSPFGDAVEVRYEPDDRLASDTRDFVRDIAMGRHSTRDPRDAAVAADVALWRRAREELIRLLTSNRDVELTNVSLVPGHPVLISCERGRTGGVYRMNPFTWARRHPSAVHDGHAWLRMGPALLLLHETRHHFGCFVRRSNPCRPSSGDGLVAGASDAVEAATMEDIDAVARTLELPLRHGVHDASPGGPPRSVTPMAER